MPQQRNRGVGGGIRDSYRQPRGRSPAVDAEAADIDIVVGRHPVLEALRHGRALNRVWIQERLGEGSIREIKGIAESRQIPVNMVPRERLDALAGGVAHQGVAASVSPQAFLSMEGLEALVESDPDAVLLILDQIQDPHNLGAMLRVAEATGIRAVIIPERGGVGLTAAVAKASAGALEYVPVVRVGNVVQAIERIQGWGFFVYAATPEAQPIYTQVRWTGKIGIVIGSEGKGVRPLVKAHCDVLVKLPMMGHVGSLNAATAAAVLAFEVVRQRSQNLDKENP